jgi:hypothetical protein
MSYRSLMSTLRVWPLVLGVVGGCFTQSSGPTGGDYPPPDPYPYPTGYDAGSYDPPPNSYGCHQDSDCGGTLVCARDGECMSAAQVRIIHVTWTLGGQLASADTCKTAPPLELAFTDITGASQFGFAPVPCMEGKFTVDKMPIVFTGVQMGPEYDYGAGGASGTFDTTGTVALDLPY